MMETSLYDNVNMKSAKKMKTSMTLDFNASQQKTKQEKLTEILASPDVGLLMMASPDLERFIIQQNGLQVLTTPTPTTQILFPKSVTEEQEAYARGFVDALVELHKNRGQPVILPTAGVAGLSSTSSMVSTNSDTQRVPSSSFAAAVPSRPATVATLPPNLVIGGIGIKPQFTTTVPLPGSATRVGASAGTASSTRPLAQPVLAPPRPASQADTKIGLLPLMPQTVYQPSGASGGIVEFGGGQNEHAQTVPVSPIDMDHQEVQKLERKRARNRVAAMKCRNRKLERISRLEDRVKELKGQNSQLSDSASSLREQVCRLKQDIIDHVNNGCQVMLSHNML